MKQVLKLVALWFCLGTLYFALEGFWRIPQGGYANIAMLPVGGLCGVAVGGINQCPRFYKLPVILQSALGTVIVLAVEFGAGCLLNLHLGLHLWNYSGRFGNIMGQICLPYALLWFAMMPLCIWTEDTLRWGFWRERHPYSLFTIYGEFLTGR